MSRHSAPIRNGEPDSSSALPAVMSPEGAERLRPAVSAPSGPAALSGKDALKAWREAESALAAAKRNGRGHYRKKPAGGRFQAGSARIMPPDRGGTA